MVVLATLARISRQGGLSGAWSKALEEAGKRKHMKKHMVKETENEQNVPRVVIIGAGFGGLQAARALRRASIQVTVIDRSNHHLFQPLETHSTR